MLKPHWNTTTILHAEKGVLPFRWKEPLHILIWFLIAVKFRVTFKSTTTCEGCQFRTPLWTTTAVLLHHGDSYSRCHLRGFHSHGAPCDGAECPPEAAGPWDPKCRHNGKEDGCQELAETATPFRWERHPQAGEELPRLNWCWGKVTIWPELDTEGPVVWEE